VTLVRTAVVVVLILSGLVVFYGLILDRSGQNIAFLVAGLVVLGVTAAFVAAWFLQRALADARWGRGARALLGSLAGGIFAIGAAMSLAAASVFAILTRLT
jgi:hypothetical protein